MRIDSRERRRYLHSFVQRRSRVRRGEGAMTIKPALTDRFRDAFSFASRAHAEQPRKGTSIPYVSHLMAVAALVLEHCDDEETAIAALLHDAPEDQGGFAMLEKIHARFGKR